MRDFVWIALIIVIYLLVIKPLFQGVANKPAGNNNPLNRENKNKSSGANNSNGKNDKGEYVDYEEVD